MNLRQIESHDQLVEGRAYLVFIEFGGDPPCWTTLELHDGIFGIGKLVRTKVEWCEAVYELPEKPEKQP